MKCCLLATIALAFGMADRAPAMMPESVGHPLPAPDGLAVDARGYIYTSATRGPGAGGLVRLRPGTRVWEKWGSAPAAGSLLGMVVDERRRLLFACAPSTERGSVVAYGLDQNAPPRVVASKLGARLNGIALHGDALYVSHSGFVPGFTGGCVWRLTLDADGREKDREKFARLTFPNGLAVSRDGRFLYVAQTSLGVLAGRLTMIEVATRQSHGWKVAGMPDGLALDSARSRLYVAVHQGGAILAVEEGALHAEPRAQRLPAPFRLPERNPKEADGTWNPASVAVDGDGSLVFSDPWRLKRPWDRLTLLWKGNPTHHHVWRCSLPRKSQPTIP